MKIQSTPVFLLLVTLVGNSFLPGGAKVFAADDPVNQVLDYVEGEALVLFTEDPTEPNSVEINEFSSGVFSAEEAPKLIMESRLNASERGFSVEPLILFDDADDVRINSYAESVNEEKIAIGIVRSQGASTDEIIEQLKGDPAVATVQPNYLYQVFEPIIEEEGLSYPNAENMENASRLYGIFNNSSNAGVRADMVWAQGFTGQGVVVADIDTGVDMTHPDLQANIWQNPGETDCTNRRDDDNNGFVDDCRGWDFLSNDNNPSPSHPHGTHTSGTIAAVRNSDGIVGVAPDAKIMVIRTGDASGITTAAIVAGIDYAAKNGADVINLSLGGGRQCPNVERNVVQRAFDAGVFLAISSGNSGRNTSSSPANCPNAFGVGATDSNKALASFSSYSGDLVDGVGPGVGILSSVPGGGYQSMSGTSMSAPAIAGIAALMKSKNPNLTPQQISDIMCQTAEDLGTPGKDERFGCGFISAEKAVAGVTTGNGTTPTPTPTTPPQGGENACHLIKNQADLWGSTIFATPFNPFDPSEMLMTTQCLGTQATAMIGTGKNTQFIYSLGYVYAADQWYRFLYNGTNQVSADWSIGTATANLSQVYNPTAPTFFLAYICLLVNNEWKCGCSDTTCAQPKWSIQAFQ